MTAEAFHLCYDVVRSLPTDINSLNRQKKDDLIQHLSSALLALKHAEKTIFKLTDTIASSNAALVKRCEENRGSNRHQDNNQAPHPSLPAKEPPTIILKPKKPQNPDEGNPDTVRTTIETRYSDALKKVNVTNARVTERGSIVVNVPNNESYQKATTNLSSALASDYVFENPKKLFPKLKIVNLPKDLNDSSIVDSLCDKDDNLSNMIQEGEKFEIIKSWDVKNKNDSSIIKRTVVFKCSPKIRNYIMNINDGYVYFNCLRCKVFDHFFVSQCYQCQGFNHFANSCPDKNKSPTCGRCSESHLTKDCRKNIDKCSNCVKTGSRKNINHRASSINCPQLIREQNIIMRKTDFDGEKK